ncbi:unnamed protein product [Larinioides sclopetarius]|uniref:Uncharacterized protein n=1 Tax=Larinioides sclopetarius TaxID=280406 RepID=A0AAV2ALM4_9ARAC
MTENVSHVVVHHLFDGVNMLNMTCCIVLSVIVVLILLIILVLVIYIVMLKTKQRAECPRTPNLMGTLRNASRAVSNSYKEELSNRRSNQFPVFDNHGMSLNSNLQDIPMSTFKTEEDGRRADSSNSSSGGLREFLFPSPHDGEIIYEPPPKVVAFAGKVFATPRARSRASSVIEPKVSKLGTSNRNSDSVNTSMEWDYFEPKSNRPSNVSNETGFDGRRTVNICWV